MERKNTVVIKINRRLLTLLQIPAMAWRKIRKDKIALAGSILASLLFLLAVFCYVVIPDKTTYANRVCVPIGNQPPGFEITMLRIIENKPTEHQNFLSKLIYGTKANDVLVPLSSSYYEGTDIVIKEFSASGDSSFESRYNIADVVYPVNTRKGIIERNRGLFFETVDGSVIEESINDIQGFIDGQYLVKKKFILGTDRYGRDVLSRLMAATRGTMLVAFFATLVAIVFGLIFGLMTGISRGKDKTFFNWILQSLSSIPAMLLIIGIMFIVGQGFWKVCLVTGVIMSAEIARVIAGTICASREKKFIDGVYALGITRRQILRRHILPDIQKPFLAAAGTVFCGVILVESGLSFLGVGMNEYYPTWGSMIRENFGYIIVPGYAYLTLLPGTALFLVSLLFVILADRFQRRLGEKYYWMSV
jgi:ABC-type dipeptide/oligopeptide/nickel transport system permease subunit